MADNNTNEDNGAAAKGPWTEEEKYFFLLQVINQLLAAGDQKVKVGEINVPGRTTKSLTHFWAKVKGEAAAAGKGEYVIAPKQSGTKRRAASTLVENGEAVPKQARKRATKAKGLKDVANMSAEANADVDANSAVLPNASGFGANASSGFNTEGSYENTMFFNGF